MDKKKSTIVDDKTGIKELDFGRKEVFPDICVCCGQPVPEGRMICWSCEHEFDEDGMEAFRGKRNTENRDSNRKYK